MRPRARLDARSGAYAEPLVEVIRRVRGLRPGETLEVLTADRMSRLEIPRWAAKAGHRVVSVAPFEGGDRIVVAKGG